MTKDEELARIREVGERIIQDLPNIKDLRDRASSLHHFSVEQFKLGNVSFEEVKYGFTKSAYQSVRDLEREYVNKRIKLEKLCDCSGKSIIGSTVMILPNGEEHLSWCSKAKEFEKKYIELKEKLNET